VTAFDDIEMSRRHFMAIAAAAAAPMQPENIIYKSNQIHKVKTYEANEARYSFKVFRQTIRPNMKWNWMVEEITSELQMFYNAFEKGKRPKLAIQLPPQHGKSWSAEDFAAWVAGKHTDWKAIYASYSADLGTLRNRNLYRLFKSPRYQEIFPDFVIEQPGYQCNTDLIEYCGDTGSFRNTTIEGTINGMELHLGIVDDYAKGRAEANSKNARDKTWRWFTDDFMARFAQDSATLILCTRWHIDDVIGRLAQKEKRLRQIKFSAVAEQDEEFRKKGDPLFPALKSKKFLLERKSIMSPGSWSSEYQQSPVLIGDSSFPIEKIRIVQVFDRKEIANSVLSIDKAGTAGGDGSYTAIVLMHKMKNGTYVIERVMRGRWAALDRETLIKRMAEDCRNDLSPLGVGFKVVIEQEPGSGGLESAQSTIRNLAGFNVVADKPGRDRSKEVRADPLACAVQAGSVFLHAGPWVPDFLEECGNWPQGYKDQVDAASQAFFHLTGGQKGYDLNTWVAAFG
jgi:predicted phage terminase large subunit-like protein